MCDTMGALSPLHGALFAKNSDRSPNEPQVLEYRPAMDHAPGEMRATYIRLAKAPHSYATLLSRPVWMWGAEMGVNEHGVCIGNEAVFTKGRYGKTGLTGMDLLRLALERAATAREAADTIIDLLERHGQGGNCGYDHSFFYDNSFLIMDRQTLYVLETAGREWALASSARASISNRLGLGANADAYSGGGAKVDFAKKHLEPVYSRFSGSARRVAQTAGCLSGDPGLAGLLAGLRTHEHPAAPLTQASVSSPCMHAGGLVGDHTTASLAVQLGAGGEILVWATGCSTPCLSLFKPWRFGAAPGPPVFLAGDAGAEAYWRKREAFHRAAIGRTLPAAFYAEQAALEAAWQAEAAGAGADALDVLAGKAAGQERAFYAKWQAALPGAQTGKKRFLSYWDKKTKALAAPARPAVGGG